MSTDVVISIATDAMNLAFKVAMPLLLAGLVVGLIVSVFQAVTQIQEQTLAFVPKLVAVAATFLIALPWLLQLLVKYTTELFRSLPSFVS